MFRHLIMFLNKNDSNLKVSFHYTFKVEVQLSPPEKARAYLLFYRQGPTSRKDENRCFVSHKNFLQASMRLETKPFNAYASKKIFLSCLIEIYQLYVKYSLIFYQLKQNSKNFNIFLPYQNKHKKLFYVSAMEGIKNIFKSCNFVVKAKSKSIKANKQLN